MGKDVNTHVPCAVILVVRGPDGLRGASDPSDAFREGFMEETVKRGVSIFQMRKGRGCFREKL